MQDLRAAIRALTVRPGFTVVAVLTLALGVGAHTAVYTVVHGVLLEPLPYAEPDAVVVLQEESPRLPNPISVSWLNYRDWLDRSRSFEAMGAFRTLQLTLTSAGDAERLTARMITSTLMPLLGVELPLGRHFTPADDSPGAAPVALLSHDLWTRRFGAASDVLGRTIVLDDQPHAIVGVLPPGFELFQHADVYVPLGPWAATLPDDRGWHPGILPVARLRHGVPLERAQAEMTSIAADLAAEHPAFNRDVGAVARRLEDVLVQNAQPSLLVLLGAVSFVLLIACANVAHLLLARGVGRQKEMAVRAALGGTRARLLGQLVVESVVLSLAGGAAGLLAAAWGVWALSGAMIGLPRAPRIGIDPPVLAFALVVTLSTALVTGVVPAIQSTRFDVREALAEESRAAGSRRQHRLRRVLVTAEIALAMVLLVGAGLMVRSYLALRRVEPGFDRRHLLVIDLPLSSIAYREHHARASAVSRILERVGAIPGVQRAAVTTGLPMAGGGVAIHFNVAGRPPRGPADYLLAGYRAVTPGYFETMRMPLLKGRGFEARDREGAVPVAVINETMARQVFGGTDPIGQRFAIGTEPDAESRFFEIVGVVGDVLQSFESRAGAEYYLPYGQRPDPVLVPVYRAVSLVVRAANEPATLAAAVRAAIRESDADLPLVNVRTMEQAMASTVAQPRLRTVLLVVFAIGALMLAVVGVYGVTAYTVSERKAEIGLRMALGASESDVVRMVVGEGVRLAAAGIAFGLLGSVLAARVLQGLLFGTSALDAATFLGASLALASAALAASYVPARRAAALAPARALTRGHARSLDPE